MGVNYDARPWGNPPPFNPMRIVTRIAGRSPQWKSHNTMGDAKRALSYHGGYSWSGKSELWTYDGEWKLEDR